MKGRLLQQRGTHTEGDQRVGDRGSQRPQRTFIGEQMHLDLGQHRHHAEHQTHADSEQYRPAPVVESAGQHQASAHHDQGERGHRDRGQLRAFVVSGNRPGQRDEHRQCHRQRAGPDPLRTRHAPVRQPGAQREGEQQGRYQQRGDQQQ